MKVKGLVITYFWREQLFSCLQVILLGISFEYLLFLLNEGSILFIPLQEIVDTLLVAFLGVCVELAILFICQLVDLHILDFGCVV
jgi:hypothetical protein